MSKKKNKNKNKSDFNKTIIIKKVSNEKEIKKKNKENMRISRIKKNEFLYDDENLSLTKQQKFNFDSYEFEDEMDTSFLDKRKRKREESKNLKKELAKAKRQKKQYKIVFLITLFMLIVASALSAFLLYIHINYEPKIVKKVVKEKIIQDENVVFLGDSITEGYNLDDFYGELPVVNSGISGNTTDDILASMNKRVYQYNPTKVFLLIGINDLGQGKSVDYVYDNILKIVSEIKKNRSVAKIYVESVYPVNNTDNKKIDHSMVGNRNNEDIIKLNKKIKTYCDKTRKVDYVNIFETLKDEEGNLKLEYTKEGLHMNGKGYEVITNILKQYL